MSFISSEVHRYIFTMGLAHSKYLRFSSATDMLIDGRGAEMKFDSLVKIRYVGRLEVCCDVPTQMLVFVPGVICVVGVEWWRLMSISKVAAELLPECSYCIGRNRLHNARPPLQGTGSAYRPSLCKSFVSIVVHVSEGAIFLYNSRSHFFTQRS